MINLAIIDSQQIFREGLLRLIETEEELKVVVSESKLANIDEQTIDRTDLFLIDIEILRKEHSFARKHILKKKKVIALSTEDDKRNVIDAVLAGCDGFFLKEMSYDNFIEAVLVILDGGNYIHPKMLHYILSDYQELVRTNRKMGRTETTTGSAAPVCTSRENEILQLLVNGNDNSSIAKILDISEKTVKNHLTNIFRKLDVKDRTQAAVLAIRNNWVQL